MVKRSLGFVLILIIFRCSTASAQSVAASNPVIWADIPDMSMVRVGDSYYMSSTTMHMSPGVPIMKSKDLVNWQIINYAYDTLANVDAMNLDNGKSAYARKVRHAYFAAVSYVDAQIGKVLNELKDWDLQKIPL